METFNNKRYSKEDLDFFKNIIDKKLAKSERQLASLETQLAETSSNKGNESDWVDDSSNSANLQLLDTMAHRLRKHIIDLKKALLRIEHKSYGICAITGELIDKKRVIAVPTTTKSVAAKTGVQKNKNQKNGRISGQPLNQKQKSPKIISKILSKPNKDKKPTATEENYEENWEKTEELLDEIEQLDLKDEIEDL